MPRKRKVIDLSKVFGSKPKVDRRTTAQRVKAIKNSREARKIDTAHRMAEDVMDSQAEINKLKAELKRLAKRSKILDAQSKMLASSK